MEELSQKLEWKVTQLKESQKRFEILLRTSFLYIRPWDNLYVIKAREINNLYNEINLLVNEILILTNKNWLKAGDRFLAQTVIDSIRVYTIRFQSLLNSWKVFSWDLLKLN